MKISYFNTILQLVAILIIYLACSCCAAQNDTVYITSKFEKAALIDVGKIYSSNKNENLSQIINSKIWKKSNNKKHFYFGFNSKYEHILFTLSNKESLPRSLRLEFSNSHINEISTYVLKGNAFLMLNASGIAYPFESRLISHRKFVFPLEISGNESRTFLIKIKKEIGHPLITSIDLLDKVKFDQKSVAQYLIIGLYFGLSILSILFSLFAFYFLRNSSYLIYALYVVFLGLFISSYLGIFQQYFLGKDVLFNKYLHYVLFSEVSLLLFFIFSQKVLMVKENLPRISKAVHILVLTLILIRFSIHFIFQHIYLHFMPVIMKIWYGIILLVCLLIVFELIVFYKKNKKRTSFFAIAYLFMITGTFITVLYHSSGAVNSYIYGLPVIFYSSFLEILFLTFTIVFMVKEIYDERNVLSNQLAYQQQRFLTAFIDGQEKERERIGKELHDNVGSRLGNFKRLFSKKYSNEKMNNVIDQICNDVRELSHQITPSEIKLVGLPGAIIDLVTRNSDEQLTIEFNCYEFPEKVDENIASNLYRVVQESLNNIIKHAEANSVDVQLIGHKDYLTLSIEDDGKGFNNSKILSGMGLQNMKSRVEQLKGNFLLDSTLNKGTSILITIPIN
tara:strand:+ start:150003 stop:151862 length:1860 start_codon:yes stop_codon:yes gene_type:complete